jgi:hypothetical protein
MERELSFLFEQCMHWREQRLAGVLLDNMNDQSDLDLIYNGIQSLPSYC